MEDERKTTQKLIWVSCQLTEAVLDHLTEFCKRLGRAGAAPVVAFSYPKFNRPRTPAAESKLAALCHEFKCWFLDEAAYDAELRMQLGGLPERLASQGYQDELRDTHPRWDRVTDGRVAWSLQAVLCRVDPTGTRMVGHKLETACTVLRMVGYSDAADRIERLVRWFWYLRPEGTADWNAYRWLNEVRAFTVFCDVVENLHVDRVLRLFGVPEEECRRLALNIAIEESVNKKRAEVGRELSDAELALCRDAKPEQSGLRFLPKVLSAFGHDGSMADVVNLMLLLTELASGERRVEASSPAQLCSRGAGFVGRALRMATVPVEMWAELAGSVEFLRVYHDGEADDALALLMIRCIARLQQRVAGHLEVPPQVVLQVPAGQPLELPLDVLPARGVFGTALLIDPQSTNTKAFCAHLKL